MYKKCFSLPIEKSEEIRNNYTVLIPKNKIKNPINKYYKHNRHKLVIDCNGLEFLKINYPLFFYKLKEIDKSEFNGEMVWDGDEIDIRVKGKYEYYYYRKDGKLKEKKPIGDKCLGLSKWGDPTFWNTSKQIIEHQLNFVGLMGNRKPNKLLRFKREDLNEMFDPQYFENTKITIGGKWFGSVLSKEENKW